MNGHPRDEAKVPYMTGGRTSKGRAGGGRQT